MYREVYRAFIDNKLEKFSTDRLLNFYRQIPRNSHGDDYLTSRPVDDNFTLLDYKNKLKEILATREHIPTKREAQAIRKKKRVKKLSRKIFDRR